MSLTTLLTCADSKHGMLRAICLPEVNLPRHESVIKTSDLLEYLNTFTVASTVELVAVLSKIKDEIKKISSATTKNDAKPVLAKIQNIFIKEVVQSRDLLPPDYKFFGSGDSVKNLLTFVQTNPFFTSAITHNANSTFSINSVPVSGGPSTYFSNLMLKLSDDYPRINATFKLEPSGEISIVELKEVQAGGASNLKENSKSDNDKAADLLFLLLVYVQTLHALIHIFHYINVVTIVEATQKYPAIQAWSLPYLPNIAVKYVEVYNLLLPPKGGGQLNGGGTILWKGDEGKTVNAFLRDILCEWGSYKTANEFTEKFLFKHFPAHEIANSGLLVQFRKHAALIHGYATDISHAFRAANEAQYHEANAEIQVVLSQTGHNVSAISDIPTWTELMSVTGLLHGSTLSYTRIFATHEILSRFNPKTTKYTKAESDSVNTALLTITGVMDDHHVFASGLSTLTAPQKKDCCGVLAAIFALFCGCQSSSCTKPTTVVQPLHPLAKSVLIRYDAASTALKEEYFKEIREGNPERFRDLGWILSDYFLDGIDGKQLTIATYI